MSSTKHFKHNDLKLILIKKWPWFSNGRYYLNYKLYKGNDLIFEGKDYSPAPDIKPLSNLSAAGLLSFLLLKPGDSDIIDSYNDIQLKFLKELDENISLEWREKLGEYV